jgi:hypothetical protein
MAIASAVERMGYVRAPIIRSLHWRHWLRSSRAARSRASGFVQWHKCDFRHELQVVR